MALVESVLKSQLISGFTNHNDSTMQAASKITDGIDSYIKGITNLGGGSFTSMTGLSILKTNLNNIFLAQESSGVMVGNKVSQAIDDCAKTLMTIYQNAPPVTAGSFAGFKSQMITLFGGYQNSGAEFGQKLSGHIHNYFSLIQIQGVIPGSPPIFFNGPPR